ncbi:MAG TPA: response regulator transcription factor, partial [Thermomicrobiales bacterium]|nr:response regulator transcription factor [Thermomicrobiales bacterium]
AMALFDQEPGGSGARCLAYVAVAMGASGEHSQAARMVEAYSAWEADFGRPLWQPVRQALVQVVRQAKAELGDAAFEAEQQAGHNLTTAQALEEARAWADHAIAAPPSPRPDTAAPSHDLSSRELEVLEWIAAGKSNQEIADALSISVRTVKTHVTSILTKLDVSSRSAATAYAHREGLV